MNGRKPIRSVIGGIVYPRPGSGLARGQFSWPFARLDVDDEQVALRPRGMFGRFVQPVIVRFSEVERIERQKPPRLLDYGIRVRFRVASPDVDRIQFWGFRAPMQDVLEIF